MSRSYKKTPIFGNIPAKSEKYAKRVANRKLRKRVHDDIAKGIESLITIKSVSDVWSMPKDGKHFQRTDFVKFSTLRSERK